MSSNSTFLVLLGVGLALVLGLFLFGGGGAEQAATESPSPDSTITTTATSAAGDVLTVDIGADRTVDERETVQLFGRVSGEIGAVKYSWAARGGLGVFSNARTQDPIYTAPSACDCEDCVLLILTVTDGRGRTASDSFMLTVRDPLACPPDPCPPAPVCVVIDPCAPPIEEACPPRPDVPCESPCITDIPPAAGCGPVIGPCPCQETECAFIWTATWPFDPVPGRPADRPKPRIVRHFPAHIAEGSSFVLQGTISNPACASGCYVWTASKGTLEGTDTLTPTYWAPMTDRPHGETVTISLVLYDGSGGRSYDQIRLTIDNLDYDGPPAP